MLALIRELPKERNVTVLLSSHLLYQVQEICDRVGIFVRGKLVAHGPVQELASRLARVGVIIEVGTDGWEAEGAVRGVAGVKGVEQEGEIFVVSAERDIRYDIAKALTDRGLQLWHLRKRGEELDDIYRQYFTGEAPLEEGNGRT
jgi:ABC-2 type transport system ATP-binding protein